jgi:hypothetical protein
MSRTIADREAMAREHECPRCSAAAGNPCRSRNRHGWFGPELKGVHPERMALLPFELDWHRVKNDAGKLRAIDNRVTPHVTYEVGKDESSYRYGYNYYLACWREGVADTTQRKNGLSTVSVAKRLASYSRCNDCGRFVMFGDLEMGSRGNFRCRDRENCEAIVADQEAEARAEFLRIRSIDHDAITVSTDDYSMPVLHLSKGSTTSKTDLTPLDVDRAIEVLTAWRDARPVFDVDLTVSSGGPEWVWPDDSPV